MSATVSIVKRGHAGASRFAVATVTYDNSYPIGGEALTPAQFGFDNDIDLILPSSADGYKFEWDDANRKLKAFRNALGLGSKTIALTDDDNAATTGVALYVHIDEVIEQGTVLGHLECNCAGAADSIFRPYSGGPAFNVQHDANAATGGTALFFDENDTAGLRLSTDLDKYTGTDTSPAVLIAADDGSYLRIVDQDNPGGEAGTVQVYFDDDAANAHARLLFVSPTNVSGSDRLWVYGGEVPEATDLSTLAPRVIAFGDNPNA